MFIDLDRARIFFDIAGSQLVPGPDGMVERPTLICLHGGPGFDHTTLRPFFDRFADSHQVIYLDHRGNGRSTGAFDDMTLDRWADDIADFCAALGITRPIVLGQSFGGMVAMHYGVRHPDGPSKLVLSSTAARMRYDVTLEVFQRLGGDAAVAVARANWDNPSAETFAAYERMCLPLYNPNPAPDATAAMNRAIRKREVGVHFFQNELRHMDLRPSLVAIQCPVLVIASGHDPITPIVCGEELAAAIGNNARLEVFPDCGHGSYRDDPGGTERLLREFLAG
ncbi:MAG TPA: alpha/beta hydrolase [Paracoccaceae bacterium]|nr:alpha/beta hydrolase [Paracoccaceae bacterium]